MICMHTVAIIIAKIGEEEKCENEAFKTEEKEAIYLSSA